MKFLLLVFAISTIVPCYAEELKFDSTYKYFMREGRDIIMNSCAEGKRLNKDFDRSYWSTTVVEHSRDEMKKTGFSEHSIDTYLAAEANAMKEICPNVW